MPESKGPSKPAEHHGSGDKAREHESSEQLESDAEALDRAAGIADWFEGLSRETDPGHATLIHNEAKVLRAWAKLFRDVAAT